MKSIWKQITGSKPRTWERPIACIVGSAAIAALIIYGLDFWVGLRGAESPAAVLGFPGGGMGLATLVGALMGIYFAFGRRRAVVGFGGLLIGLAITITFFSLLAHYEWVLDSILRAIVGAENAIYFKAMVVLSAAFLIIRLGSQLGSILINRLLSGTDKTVIPEADQ